MFGIAYPINFLDMRQAFNFKKRMYFFYNVCSITN